MYALTSKTEYLKNEKSFLNESFHMHVLLAQRILAL